MRHSFIFSAKLSIGWIFAFFASPLCRLARSRYTKPEAIGGTAEMTTSPHRPLAFALAYWTVTRSSSVEAATLDPEGSGVIVEAVNWLQGTLLGTVATVVAVIAVAAVGFMMLTGRMNWRHGAVVILGCFVLFGAASIVAGIRSAAIGG